MSSPGVVSLKLGYNGQQYEAVGAQFEYYLQPTLYRIAPSFGPSQGGVMVTAIGSNFLNQSGLSCSFGSMIMPAHFNSSTSVTCYSPAIEQTAAGDPIPFTVTVEVSNNGADYTSSSKVAFTYLPSLHVVGITPFRVSQSQGSTVSIEFEDDASSTLVKYCSTGANNSPTPVIGRSERSVSCFVFPLQQQQQAVPAAERLAFVELYNEFMISMGTAVQFEYIPDYVVSSISPVALSESEGVVLIRGSNFVNYRTIMCKFGGPDDSDSVPAVFMSSEMLRCTAPSRRPSTVVSVLVSMNGVDYYGEPQSLTYFESIALSSIHPTVVSVRGGSVVTFVGTNFINSAPIYCKVADNLVPALPGYSSSSLRCRIPANDHLAVVTVNLAQNDQDISGSTSTLTYVLDPVVETISPAFGPLPGQTLVHIYGSDMYGSRCFACSGT
jgi:hypothetical protein